jgi:hypothetical protein
MSSDGPDSKPKLLILYGSETGNAESISKRIHHDAIALGYNSTWSPLKDFKEVCVNLPQWILICVHRMLVYQLLSLKPAQSICSVANSDPDETFTFCVSLLCFEAFSG